MNSGRKVGFGAGRAGKWKRASVTLVGAIGLMAAGVISGCESTGREVEISPREVGNGKLTGVPTAELKVRRTAVLKRFAEIQREVDLKAGLPMGVAIKDERAHLGDLYREAHEIERELLRRWTRGDPDVTMEQVKASF
jgi:hypothetical protein